MLCAADQSAIALLWLTLSNLGLVVVNYDLHEPGYLQRMGPHTVYTFAVMLANEAAFPEEEFCRLLHAYCKISPVKPQLYSVEKFPALDAPDFSRVYVSICI